MRTHFTSVNSHLPKLKTIQFTIFLILFSIACLAQPSFNTELVGRWGEGPRFAMDQQDQYLYLSNGTLLEIYEIQDDAWAMISQTDTKGFIQDMHVKDDIVYLAINTKGLQIIDASDQANPIEKGFLQIYGYYPSVISYQDHILYGTSRSDGLNLVDVSDLNNPEIVWTFPSGSIYNMVLKDQYLFMAKKWDGMGVLDLSNLETPIEIYTDEIENYFYLDVEDDIAAYLTGDSLVLVDISYPTQPVILGKMDNQYAEHCQLDLANNRAFMSGYSAYSIDISDISNPSLINNYSVQSSTEKLVYHDDQLTVLTGQGGAYFFDIDNTGDFELKQQISTVAYTESVAKYNDYIYLAQGDHGISILNISNPQTPQFIKSFQTDGYATYLEVQDHYLYISSEGLRIYDIADPLNPVELSKVEMTSNTYRFKVRDEILFLGCGAYGYAFINIEDLANPFLIHQKDTPGIVYNLDLVGNLAYIASGNGGIRIVDITDLYAPVEVTIIDTSWVTPVKSIKVFDNIVWFGSTNFGIRIMDITDPFNPIRVWYPQTSRGHDMLENEGLVFISGGGEGCIIFDTQDKTDPEMVGLYNSPGSVVHTILDDQYIYIADDDAGFSIFRYDHCAQINIDSKLEDISCFDQCDGKIAVESVENAMQPLQYEWSTGEHSDQIEALCPGTYYVTITDAQNCSISDTFEITQPSEIIFEEIIKTDIDATNEFGSIEISVSGGSPDYEYHWTGPDGFESISQNLFYLAEGCYQLEVIDSRGCSTLSDPICIDDLTSVSFFKDTKKITRCYPNPARDFIRIEYNPERVQSEYMNEMYIEFYSGTGGKIKSGYTERKSVDLTMLVAGVYLLRIQTGPDHFEYHKIMVYR